MSIIVEALKKAQRRSGKKVEKPPPFDLKKEKPPEMPPQAKPDDAAEPPTKTARPPRAKPLAKPGKAPRPGPGAKPKAVKPRRWSLRIPVITVVILGFFVVLVYYVNRIYLPDLQRGGIELTPTRPAPTARAMSEPAVKTEPEQEATGAETGPAEEPAAEEPTAPGGGRESESQAQTTADLAKTVPEPEIAQPAEVPAESPPPTAYSQTAASGPEEQPPEALAQEPVEESTFGAVETAVSDREDGLEDLNAGIETPPEIVQKDRDTDRPLREDIYHFNMAVFFQRQNDIPSALKEYNMVLELSPFNAEAYSNMGVLYSQIGEFDKAVALLQKALLIDPTYSKAHNNIALAYYRSEHLDQALEHLRRAVELEPINLESYNNLGLVYKKMDDYQRAEEAFARALSIDPDHTTSNYNMALLYEQTGQYDRAVKHYRVFIRSKGITAELAEKVNQRLSRLTRTEPAR